MKKLSVLTALSFSSILLIGCSSIKPSHSSHRPDRNDPLADISDTVELKDAAILAKNPATGEYTHEMAEADADDQDIEQKVGSNDIDKELPGSENDGIPYSKEFLAKKKTQRMQFWVDYFTKNQRERFQRFINNGEEYRHHIEQVFVEYGLPKELYFVGLIESGYYLGAKSHASAVGPWQFIRGTGSRYGLKITSEIDERQDLFKATRAAAEYFRDLHNVFSSWELALSAYNAGENGIIRRIMKHGTRDFYAMSGNKQLPSETINYVPKVLAAMHVVNNAAKYGFDIPKKKYRLFDLTELRPIKKNVSLAVVASRLNTTVSLLKKLNPELRRNSTPRVFAGTYFLRIPKSRYERNMGNVEATASIEKEADVIVAAFSRPETRKEMNRRTATVETDIPASHKVRRGETLISISRKYKVTPRELASINHFRSWKTQVRVGQNIALTRNDNAEEQSIVIRQASFPKLKVTNRPIIYQVKKGDNLIDLARIFNLNASKLSSTNKIKRGRIQVGQRIVLPNTQKAIYTVKQGDKLKKVAKSFNCSSEALVKLNSLKQMKVFPGQKLIVNID